MAARQHNIGDWSREEALRLRLEENLTYRQIAEMMGCSKAYVYQLLQGTEATKRSNFRRWRDDSTPYPELNAWANLNQISKQELAIKLGYSPGSNSQYIVYRRIKTGELTKSEIDKLLKMTHMSYEKLFRRET